MPPRLLPPAPPASPPRGSRRGTPNPQLRSRWLRPRLLDLRPTAQHSRNEKSRKVSNLQPSSFFHIPAASEARKVGAGRSRSDGYGVIPAVLGNNSITQPGTFVKTFSGICGKLFEGVENYGKVTEDQGPQPNGNSEPSRPPNSSADQGPQPLGECLPQFPQCVPSPPPSAER